MTAIKSLPADPITLGEQDKTLAAVVTSKRQSLYLPPEDSDESEEIPGPSTNVQESQQQLNSFLKLRDVSPVRSVLSVSWEKASERTKRRYLRKAEQSISAVLDVIAPGASGELLTELCSRHMLGVGKEPDEQVLEKRKKESEVLEALAESYLNAQHWSTRRQLLSLMADKLSLNELRKFIPIITRYRYNIARRHRLLHGRGAPVSVNINNRLRVDHAKLEHFISFITSPHIIQDVPFGEKIIKLSTGEAITTPNVIRTMIPERIVQQYQQYCSETSFTCLSRSTLHRILNVCSASTRKSLQGLDNFSALGSQAFDDLAKLVDKLVEYGEPHEWGGSIKELLRSSKQYLKGDYKVN